MTTLLDRYQRIAPVYDLLDYPFEHWRYRRIRPLLFQGLAGRLLDAGVGTGRNIPFYPPGAEAVGIDISPAMLRLAQRRGDRLDAAVDLRRMDVTSLEFPDSHFDAVVATFLFCVLPEERQPAALRELARVTRPAGTLRLLEYVRPREAFHRLFSRLWEPWMAWAYGAGFDRRTEEHAQAVGLEIVESRFVVDDLMKLISIRNCDISQFAL